MGGAIWAALEERVGGYPPPAAGNLLVDDGHAVELTVTDDEQLVDAVDTIQLRLESRPLGRSDRTVNPDRRVATCETDPDRHLSTGRRTEALDHSRQGRMRDGAGIQLDRFVPTMGSKRTAAGRAGDNPHRCPIAGCRQRRRRGDDRTIDPTVTGQRVRNQINAGRPQRLVGHRSGTSTTAPLEGRAMGRHPIGRRNHQPADRRVRVPTFFPGDRRYDDVAGHRSVDEHHPTFFVAPDAGSTDGKSLDADRTGGRRPRVRGVVVSHPPERYREREDAGLPLSPFASRNDQHMPDLPPSVLLKLTGPDKPGVAAGLFHLLDREGTVIEDVEQVTIRRSLVLGVVFSTFDDRTLFKDVLFFAWENGLQVSFEPVESTPTRRENPSVVTVLGRKVTGAQLQAVAETIANQNGNIDRLVRLSKYPVVSYEFDVLGADRAGLRTALLSVAQELAIDIAVQPGGLARRAHRLVVLDVDSTLIRDEAVELLAGEAGQAARAKVEEVTAAAMRGELDFAAALRERVELLAGLDKVAIDRARAKLRLTPGARTFVRTLKRLGFRVAIVSGGFTVFTERLAEILDVDHHVANQLEIEDGVLTGRLVGPIVDRAGKAAALRQIAAAEGVSIDQTVAVGDGANDLDMLATAGFGIAFNAKPVVREAADTALNVPFLDAILFLLGVPRAEVEAADRS